MSDGTMYEEPVLPETAYGEVATVTAQRSVISVEERRLLIVQAVETLKDRGIADISMNTIATTLDLTLDTLGVRVTDEVYTPAEADGMPVCPTCGGRGVEMLTGDERAFFAYMSAQRHKTVAEKDVELRDQKRERWQAVAVWFDPTWKPE